MATARTGGAGASLSPFSASFHERVLAPLAQRQRAGEAEAHLRDELLRAILPWVRQQIARQVRRIPANADPANVSSMLHEAAFQAVNRLDWEQWAAWPMYLGTLVRRAAQDAARSDDYLSRQQRVLRTRFRLAVEDREARIGRAVSGEERRSVALEIAGGRSDLASLLEMGWHPREVAEVPDEVHPVTTMEDQVESRMLREDVRNWLHNELPESVRAMVLVWLESPRSQTLPRRLESHLQPFVARLLTLIDEADDDAPTPSAPLPPPRASAPQRLQPVGR